MQYLYLLIFVLFIVLNVVIGLASSRSKKRRAVEDKAPAGSSGAGYADAAADQVQQDVDREPVLEPQTADSIVESLFAVQEEKAALPGREERLASASVASEREPLKTKPGSSELRLRETLNRSALSEEKPAPMVNMDRPSEKITLSIEKNLLESEVASRSAERQRAQDEKFNVYDLYEFQDVETAAWENVNKLPPLKRAIVLSEILGSPKALSEDRQSQ
jgi:hypothetical protein